MERSPVNAGPLIAAATLIGIGMGGFVDGIVLHQILQWHHMLSVPMPPTDLLSVKVNMVWDGLFHAFTWIVTFIGLLLLWRAGQRNDVPRTTLIFAGSLALGWGLFNVVEGLIDHQLLGIHHVHPGAGQLAWTSVSCSWSRLDRRRLGRYQARAFRDHIPGRPPHRRDIRVTRPLFQGARSMGRLAVRDGHFPSSTNRARSEGNAQGGGSGKGQEGRRNERFERDRAARRAASRGRAAHRGAERSEPARRRVPADLRGAGGSHRHSLGDRGKDLLSVGEDQRHRRAARGVGAGAPGGQARAGDDDGGPPDGDVFAELEELGGLLEAHVIEEEQTLFPKVSQEVDEADLRQLGARMSEMVEQLRRERAPRMHVTEETEEPAPI